MTSPTPDAGVRAARTSDADDLGRIHARAWQASYGELLPDRADSALAPASLAESWRHAVSEPPTPAHRVLVATEGPDLVGFLALSPAADADADAGQEAELLILLIEPGHERRGHGSRLLNAAADTLRDNGFRLLRAWIPAADSARGAFLQGAGFAPDGASRLLDAAGDGTTTVRELRLAAALVTDT